MSREVILLLGSSLVVIGGLTHLVWPRLMRTHGPRALLWFASAAAFLPLIVCAVLWFVATGSWIAGLLTVDKVTSYALRFSLGIFGIDLGLVAAAFWFFGTREFGSWAARVIRGPAPDTSVAVKETAAVSQHVLTPLTVEIAKEVMKNSGARLRRSTTSFGPGEQEWAQFVAQATTLGVVYREQLVEAVMKCCNRVMSSTGNGTSRLGIARRCVKMYADEVLKKGDHHVP